MSTWLAVVRSCSKLLSWKSTFAPVSFSNSLIAAVQARDVAEFAASYHQTFSVLPLPSILPVLIAPALVLLLPLLLHAASVSEATSKIAAATMCFFRINYLLVIEMGAHRGRTPLRADLVAM